MSTCPTAESVTRSGLQELRAHLTQTTVLTFQLRPIDVIAACCAVFVVAFFLRSAKARADESTYSSRRPSLGIVGWIAWIVAYAVEEVLVRLMASARIHHAFVSASCAVLESPKFRENFQEFIESEHVKESCARVVQVVAETPGVAQGIHAGALNTGMIAALGVARQVPLVGRFVPTAEKCDRDGLDPLSPRREQVWKPAQAYTDLPPRMTSAGRGQSADARDRGFSSASTQASSATDD